jgi:hypothetical protein
VVKSKVDCRLSNVENVLYVDSNDARESYLRMYQRTKFYLNPNGPRSNAEQRNQLFALNEFHVDDPMLLSELLSLPNTFFIGNTFKANS